MLISTWWQFLFHIKGRGVYFLTQKILTVLNYEVLFFINSDFQYTLETETKII